MASELLMEISQDERQRAIMRSRRMYETDMMSRMLTAEDNGKREGEVLGIAKVFELLDKGVSIEDAKKMLGLQHS